MQTAHTLKGMSINFGAVALVRECEILQRMAESALDSEIAIALERVKAAFALVHQTLNQFTKSPGGEFAGGPPQAQADDQTLGG